MSIVKKTKISLLTGLTALVLSCGSCNSSPDNPRDGGRQDAGISEDGGPVEDGGPGLDGSVFDDGGLDGSVPNPDGGPTEDGGSLDGGVVNLTLHFPSIGTGNAVFGRFSKNENPVTFLYDCGESTADNSDLVRYLTRQMGESLSIDNLVISSKRTSSLKGCLPVLKKFEVGNIYLPQTAYDYIFLNSPDASVDLRTQFNSFQPRGDCQGNTERNGGLCLVKKDAHILETESFSLDLIVPYDNETPLAYDSVLLRANYRQTSFLLAADCKENCYERVKTSWTGNISQTLGGNTLQIHEVVGELLNQSWLSTVKNLVIAGDTAKKGDGGCQDLIQSDLGQLLTNYSNLTSGIYRTESCTTNPTPLNANFILTYDGSNPPQITTQE